MRDALKICITQFTSLTQSAPIENSHLIEMPVIPANSLDAAQAIARGEFSLSLSTMLGCDYIFIHHRGMHELLQPRRADKTIAELLNILDASPRQSMVVGADEALDGTISFTRYDYLWENHQVTKISITPVTHREQIAFMQMMFDCSTPR